MQSVNGLAHETGPLIMSANLYDWVAEDGALLALASAFRKKIGIFINLRWRASTARWRGPSQHFRKLSCSASLPNLAF